MGLIMGGNLLRADLEAALACIVAESSDGDGSEAAVEEAKRWREGLQRNRDIADVRPLLPS
jgi:lysine-specific demethylase 8